ncbi:MAG: hypothetical protein A2Y95_00520 [Deltaproteobacteria bacterium RBG_13_65_10]|nr:MAG: hypothetical protein A2Y95_00520 [Deltaproteobacteria bacterium RBG_13_65_10]
MLAALAYASSVPVAKTLLRDVSPLALSGGIYLAAGGVLGLLWLVSTLRAPGSRKTTIRGSEWAWLGGAVMAGGVLAPVLLFLGLRLVQGHVAGLLLNFETVFTLMLGAALYGERLGRLGWIGATCVIAGAALLSLPAGGEGTLGPARLRGAFFVVAACALWGLDNNLTQRVSLRDARQIVAVKGLAGGATNLVLALALGQLGGISPGAWAATALVGAVAYGFSIVLFVRGLRTLGVIQTGTLFALAPGFAAVLSLVFLHEPLGVAGVAALGIMTAGGLLLAHDVHAHPHVHEAMAHAHAHIHDAHHRHTHTPGEPAATPHAHEHRHKPLVHAHPHAHDIHHRHRH